MARLLRGAGRGRRLLTAVVLAAAASLSLVVLIAGAPALVTPKKNIPLADVMPVIEGLPQQVPAALKGKTPAGLAAAWPGWVAARSAAIRTRLGRGDEDSVVNLMLFGTSVTAQRRTVDEDTVIVNGRAAGTDLMNRRLDDMLNAILTPGANERLQFVRAVIARTGINPETTAGKAQARARLIVLRTRMLGEIDRFRKTTLAARQTNDRRAEFNFERLDPLPLAEQFDLIVATNILVYYDPFEQALAVANVARMLRPGGMFLSNSAVFPTPPMSDVPDLFTPVNHDDGRNVDALFWYVRR